MSTDPSMPPTNAAPCEPTNVFTAQALEVLASRGIDPAAYIRHFNPDGVWTGDRCGCIDDRCITFHHATQFDCGCLDPCIGMFLEQSPPMVPVVAHFDSDNEWWHILDDELDGADGHDDRFSGMVPKDVRDHAKAAYETWRGAEEEILHLLGLDIDEGCKLEVCPTWVGTEWVGEQYVTLSADIDPGNELAGKVWFGHFDTLEEAEERRSAFPPVMHVLSGVAGAVYEISVDQVEATAGTRATYTSGCHTCGYARTEHDDLGTPV